MNLLPKARSKNIIVQELEKELLIYDSKIDKAYNLNETSMIVFNACNGKTTFESLKHKHKFTDDLIFFALDELSRKDLLEDKVVSPFDGMNRREIIRKVGFASFVALPVISSLIAPTSAQASSVCRGTTAPNTPVNCTRGIPGCEIDVARSTCASCRAVAITPSAGCPNPDFPYECRCAPPA